MYIFHTNNYNRAISVYLAHIHQWYEPDFSDIGTSAYDQMVQDALTRDIHGNDYGFVAKFGESALDEAKSYESVEELSDALGTDSSVVADRNLGVLTKGDIP